MAQASGLAASGLRHFERLCSAYGEAFCWHLWTARCLRAETTGGEGARLALARRESAACVCVCVCVCAAIHACSQECLAVRAVSVLLRPLLRSFRVLKQGLLACVSFLRAPTFLAHLIPKNWLLAADCLSLLSSVLCNYLTQSPSPAAVVFHFLS